MRSTLTVVAVVALLAFVGCDKGTPGGPGASNPASHKGAINQAEDTFTLSVPTLSTTLKQGESKVVSLGVKRGKNFDEDVALKFEDLPKGVTVEPAAPAIKHGDSEAKVTIKAADDAALGDFTVKVVGHPTKGKEATHDLKITVSKK
jgi:hypothetical protein